LESIGRYLIVGGLLLTAVGGAVYLTARLGLPLGHLPGDIRLEGKSGGFYFPITTCILISLLLTGILNLIARWLHK
jgi:hypothetical protein